MSAPGDKSWPQRQAEIFQDRMAEWLKLRGEVALRERAAPSGLGDENDRFEVEMQHLSQRVEDAARLAMTTHAPKAWMVWQKFEILESALYADEGDPKWTDFRQLWMIAAIKADLAALGINDRPMGRKS